MGTIHCSFSRTMQYTRGKLGVITGFYCSLRQCSSAGASTSNAKIVKSSPKGDDAWRLSLLDKLNRELKESNRQVAAGQSLRASHAQMIRYAVSGDIPSIISFAHQHVRGIGKRGYISAENDQFIATSLLLIQRELETLMCREDGINSIEAVSICFSYANLWDRMRFLGNDTRTLAVLLYDSLDRWSKLRRHDESTSEIDGVLVGMGNKLSRIVASNNITQCSLYLSEADRAAIVRQQEFLLSDQYSAVTPSKRLVNNIPVGYDPALVLVDPLRDPVTSTDSFGNQYSVPDMNRTDYAEAFEAHLQLEQAAWLRVDNFTKNRHPTVTISAEQLISSWNWKKRIAESIEAQQKERIQYPLKGYLSVLSVDELSSVVVEAVTAICSQGQNLVPVSVFHHLLTAPVVRIVHTRFIQKLGVDEKQLWTAVFLEYLKYFDDADVARTHTHREWWQKCCQRQSLSPDYQAPMGEFHAEARSQLAVFLTQVVMESCLFPGKGVRGRACLQSAFGMRNVAIEEESRVAESGGRASLSKMVSLQSQMMRLFEKHQFDHILFPTNELPMTVPPRPWVDGGIGGPEYTRRKEILRNLSDYKRIDVNKEMSSRLADSYQARPVFDALNQLGATPWKINEPMLDVLCKVFGMSNDASKADLLDTLCVPQRSETIQMPKVEDVVGANYTKESVPKEKWVEYYKLKSETEKKKNEMNSLWYWMMYRVVLARHFRGQVLFFPHNMDFRGRVYPISPYLSHMGDDVNRCILKFAKGRHLGNSGLSWLKLHCINLTGKMKRQSVAERLAAADEQLDDMIDSANRPLDGRGWWLQSEEPWQTLAACMELRDATEFKGDPAEFVSHLAVHQDGSCNGLQHYAALGRDRQGGGEVNLLPSENPSDVYSSVAVRVEQKRLEDETSGEDMDLARRLRVALPQAVPRKVIKQTVMTTVYGVTMYGAVLQIKRQLKALGIDNDDTPKFAKYLALKTFASLNDAFTSSMQLKDWFRKCAKGACELMHTVEWVTPLGLPVVQPYLKAKDVKGRLVLAPVPSKQIDAFPPNFVHSLDSTHMMLTSLDCSRRGITFAAVHDCFWTHASTVDEMNKICRKQFVQLHSQPIVDQCSQWLLSRYLSDDVVAGMDEEQKARYTKLFSPQVQHGELDINEVMQSVYFFS